MRYSQYILVLLACCALETSALPAPGPPELISKPKPATAKVNTEAPTAPGDIIESKKYWSSEALVFQKEHGGPAGFDVQAKYTTGFVSRKKLLYWDVHCLDCTWNLAERTRFTKEVLKIFSGAMVMSGTAGIEGGDHNSNDQMYISESGKGFVSSWWSKAPPTEAEADKTVNSYTSKVLPKIMAIEDQSQKRQKAEGERADQRKQEKEKNLKEAGLA